MAKFKSIDKTTEHELIRSAQNGCIVSRNKLLVNNLGFAYNQAKKVKNSYLKHIEFDDLFSDAYLGLFDSIDKFDLTQDVKLVTYAGWHIKNRFTLCSVLNYKTIKTPAYIIEDMKKIIKKINLENKRFGEEEIMETSENLGIKTKNIYRYAGYFKPYFDIEEISVYSDIDIEEEIDKEKIYKLLYEKINELNPKERSIIRKLYGFENEFSKPMSLKEVGDLCGLTRERVRQIRNNCIQKLKVKVKGFLKNE